MKRTKARVAAGGPESYGHGFADGLWPSVDGVLSPPVLATIGAGAVAGDESGRLADGALEALAGAGYFGFAVPAQFEGGGGSLTECCALQRQIASLDPALAVALNMHLFSIGMMVEHWDRERDASWALLEAVATQQRVVASGFAEPGLAGSILRSNFDARRTADGYVISGVKAPCSLAARSDLVCLQFEADEDGERRLLVTLMPTEAPGISVEPTWDTLGMRASESDTMRFDEVVVPDDLVFHRSIPGFDSDPVFAAGLAWFAATTSATYIGLCRGAIEEGKALLRGARLPHKGPDTRRADLPTFQGVLGNAVAQLLVVDLACLALARELDDVRVNPLAALPAALALKYTVAGMATKLVADIVEACGAAAYGRASALSRFWRDAQAAPFHPPTRFATRQLLGRWALGMPFEFDIHDAPSSS